MTVAVLRTPEKLHHGSSKASKGGEEKIYVTVRVRPLSSKELAQRDTEDWECANDTSIAYKHALPERSPYPAAYVFDRVFGPDCHTQRVYQEGAKDVALSSMTGLNSTIFAYGQTSSGKTFTMRGVMESAVVDIYDHMNMDRERNYVLKVSALEIYNEIVKDLLNSESGPLRLMDDPERGTVVEKLTEELVRDISHLRQILAICEAQRQVGETTLNDMSSRSHQIIRLTVESFPREVCGTMSNALIATLNFVDLAGSERASQTLSEGARLKEGCHINRSLLTLSTCIRKLSVGNKTKSGHIPYRDSKLTRILQHSLGGNARTAIICTMSPAHSHVDQSRNTLSFATRAKEVTNSAHVNLVVSDKILVKQLQREVARLEAELRIPDATPTVAVSSEALLQAKELQIQKMELEMKELIAQRDAAQTRLDEVMARVKEEEQVKESARVQAEEDRLLGNQSPRSIHHTRSISLGQLPGVQSVEDQEVVGTGSRALVVRKNLCSDAFSKEEPYQFCTKVKGMSFRQSTTASLLLVQEIRKLEHLQDELGEDASRALAALQKEVECLRLAQAGMNHDAATTIKKLQDEIRDMNVQRTTTLRDGESRVPVPMSMNTSLRQELSRLQAMGESDRNEANAAIATLEEQLENVQKSLDKMILESPETQMAADEDASPNKSKTPSKKKKSIPLTMSSSSRQRLIAGSSPCSPARRCVENNENTPPRTGRENTSPHVGENTSPTVIYKQKPTMAGSEDCQGTLGSKDSAGIHRRNSSVDIRKMQNMFKTAAEENIKSIRTYVTELKERVAKLQYQKQLLLCQVLELEANESSEDDSTDDSSREPEAEVATVVRSPSSWRAQFEDQRLLILELWDKCNVSIVRRTQFYLLFKGDPADAMYMNVELQHLHWLYEHCITASSEFLQSHHHASEEQHTSLSPLSARSQNLRRERELLARRMRSRLTAEEREELFSQWGVPLEAKQRKQQLTFRIWTDPHDCHHVQASAEVVARIVGFWEPGSGASKEMFELTFAPPGNTRPFLFGWNSISTLLNF